MRDCKLRCIRGSRSFIEGDIYYVVDNKLEGDDQSYSVKKCKTIEDINDTLMAQFEIIKENFDSLTLSEINSKYGKQCYDEIIEVIESYSKPLDKVYIDVFKSSDGKYMFTIKQNLPLGDK